MFNDTTDIVVDEYDPKNTKFIRSHLPVKRAFKMGASYLKIKVGKLIITSLLIIASLSMFGIVAPFMLYDSNYSISQALENSLYDSETIQKSYEYKNSYKTAHRITRMKETMKYLSLNRFLLRRCDNERIRTNNKR